MLQKIQNILLLGIKDLEEKREVKTEEGENFEKDNKVKFYETSACQYDH